MKADDIKPGARVVIFSNGKYHRMYISQVDNGWVTFRVTRGGAAATRWLLPIAFVELNAELVPGRIKR